MPIKLAKWASNPFEYWLCVDMNKHRDPLTMAWYTYSVSTNKLMGQLWNLVWKWQRVLPDLNCLDLKRDVDDESLMILHNTMMTRIARVMRVGDEPLSAYAIKRVLLKFYQVYISLIPWSYLCTDDEIVELHYPKHGMELLSVSTAAVCCGLNRKEKTLYTSHGPTDRQTDRPMIVFDYKMTVEDWLTNQCWTSVRPVSAVNRHMQRIHSQEGVLDFHLFQTAVSDYWQ